MDISTKFDVVIWLLITVGLLGELIILAIPFLRRNRKAKVLFIFIFVCQILVLYGSFMEPRMITIAYYEVAMGEQGRLSPQSQNRFFIPKRAPEQPEDSLRIALIADWHVGPYKQNDYVQRAADHIAHMSPDAVVMPGDFVYTSPEETHFLKPLADIAATIPVYASLGNHDFNWREQYGQGDLSAIETDLRYSQRHTDTLESFGIRVLRDETETITINGQEISFVGQDDWWATGRDSAENITQGDRGILSILIQHNPDGAFFQTIPESIDLIVSGHTHGGQIRLPIIGALWSVPTEIGNTVDQGWFSLDDSTQMLYVTHGIGETGPRARMFAWPEIVVFDISLTS